VSDELLGPGNRVQEKVKTRGEGGTTLSSRESRVIMGLGENSLGREHNKMELRGTSIVGGLDPSLYGQSSMGIARKGKKQRICIVVTTCA